MRLANSSTPAGTITSSTSIAFTPHINDWSQSGLLHFAGIGGGQRIAFMFGVYCYRFYGEGAPMLIELLES